LVLNDRLVSGEHAVVEWSAQEDAFVLRDLGSANGIIVSGRRVHDAVLQVDTPVRLGRFTLRFSNEKGNVGRDAVASDPSPGKRGPDAKDARRFSEPVAEDSEYEKLRSFYDEVSEELQKRLSERRLTKETAGDEMAKQIEQVVDDLLREFRPTDGTNVATVRKLLLDDVLGFGCIQAYLEDDAVSEVMVNCEDVIFVEREGRICYTGRSFRSRSQLMTVIERIVAPLGRRIDESSPLVDARLPDGSRVNAIIPPLAIDGPCVTIRKFRKEGFSIDDLVNRGAFSWDMAEFFRVCVEERLSMVISGGTGSGKTTLLNTLSSFIPNEERVVTIEDSAELRLPQFHVVRLESRPANIEGKGEIPIRKLVKNSLRMRPDRIVIGECRGGEALDMIQAMNTGHDGSLTTVHANTARDALRRVEVMCLMAGMDLPIRAIREQIASAVNLIIQIKRFRDGSRKIISVSEITGIQNDIVITQDIFLYHETGVDDEGRVCGHHAATGIVPEWVDELRKRGVSMNLDMFQSENVGE